MTTRKRRRRPRVRLPSQPRHRCGSTRAAILCAPPEAPPRVRISPSGWKFIDVDWLRLWYPPETSEEEVLGAMPAESEDHASCSQARCAYRVGGCPWHAPGCTCSGGACQDLRDTGPAWSALGFDSEKSWRRYRQRLGREE